MRNLPFVIWMVGAPISSSIGQYVNEYLCKHTYSDAVHGIAALITLIVWALVGSILYEKKS